MSAITASVASTLAILRDTNITERTRCVAPVARGTVLAAMLVLAPMARNAGTGAVDFLARSAAMA